MPKYFWPVWTEKPCSKSTFTKMQACEAISYTLHSTVQSPSGAPAAQSEIKGCSRGKRACSSQAIGPLGIEYVSKSDKDDSRSRKHFKVERHRVQKAKNISVTGEAKTKMQNESNRSQHVPRAHLHGTKENKCCGESPRQKKLAKPYGESLAVTRVLQDGWS
jgi:hypothetical protein